MNDADWLRHIGDRGVHALADAERYLREGPLTSYAEHGFGLWCVETLQSRCAIGLCGLLKRPSLDHVDLGFAYLPAHRGQGYAEEAARATLAYAYGALALPKVVAIVSPANTRSIRLLERLGMCASHTLGSADTPTVLYVPIHPSDALPT